MRATWQQAAHTTYQLPSNCSSTATLIDLSTENIADLWGDKNQVKRPLAEKWRERKRQGTRMTKREETGKGNQTPTSTPTSPASLWQWGTCQWVFTRQPTRSCQRWPQRADWFHRPSSTQPLQGSALIPTVNPCSKRNIKCAWTISCIKKQAVKV